MLSNSPLIDLKGFSSTHQGIALTSAATNQEGSRKSRRAGKVEDHRKSQEHNRVLMLGSIRELALYRAEVLRHYGYHVQIATNRDQALDLIHAGNYDVLVLSYTLPDAVVRELADETRELRPHCPVIAISNAQWPDPIIKPDQMIMADEGPAALLSALRHVLRRQ